MSSTGTNCQPIVAHDFLISGIVQNNNIKNNGNGNDNDNRNADANNNKVLLMKFCPHDSSMLYPQEQKSTRTLRYSCRLCRYSEDARGALIYRNAIKKELGNVLSTVPTAVSDDPTLPRSQNASCMNCGHHEAVFFQSDTSDIRSDSLALLFVCCNCRHKWVA